MRPRKKNYTRLKPWALTISRFQYINKVGAYLDHETK